MKRLLLPLIAALALPTAVRADNAFGYGMQMCQMMSSGMDPFEAQKIISDSVMNNVPPSYQRGDPYAPWSPTRTTEGAIASGIASGIVDGFTAVMRMNSLRPGMQQTMEANCPDFYISASNKQNENKVVKKKVCTWEKDKFNKGKKKRKCRKKTAEEIALELPSVPSDKTQLKLFCKTNLYNSNCKKYYDMKLNAIKNPKNIQVNSVSEADELKKFADLKEKGIITEEEFNKKKKEILGL